LTLPFLFSDKRLEVFALRMGLFFLADFFLTGIKKINNNV